MTSISNYILKSRNDYNENYICKYISVEVAKKSIINHQIWMSIIENLNDEREQRVVPELFEKSEWAHERERRYVLFMYDDYEYKEIIQMIQSF